MTNGNVLLVGPQNILAGDGDYVSGKWSDMATLAFLPWAAPRTSTTSSRMYGWLGLLLQGLRVQPIAEENKLLQKAGPQSMGDLAQCLLLDKGEGSHWLD